MIESVSAGDQGTMVLGSGRWGFRVNSAGMGASEFRSLHRGWGVVDLLIWLLFASVITLVFASSSKSLENMVISVPGSRQSLSCRHMVRQKEQARAWKVLDAEPRRSRR